MRVLESVFRSSLLINLTCLFLTGLGIYSAMTMRKEAYPPVELDIIHIFTAYPGASSLQVEKHITNLIEEELQELSGIKKIDSTSVEGASTVVLELDADLSQRKRDRLLGDIRRAVKNIQDFPDEVEDDPVVHVSDSSEFFILELAFSAPGSPGEVQELADALGDEIRKIKSCKKVVLRGYRDKEVWIEAFPERLKHYHISLLELVQAVRDKNTDIPAGSVDTLDASYLIRTTGSSSNLAQIRNTVVRATPHRMIRVRDLARVSWKLQKSRMVFRTNGRNTVNMLIQKKATGDIIRLVREIRTVSDQFMSRHKDRGIEVRFTNDISKMVENRLSILFNNGAFGFVFVLLVLLLFLSKGIALVTAIGIPIAFFAALIWMNLSGITINLITMFGLVMVIGMIVDDAIIVAENIWQHYERGKPPWQATLDGTKEVIRPVTTTILTTIAAFSPLMVMSGLIGKFIAILPTTIILALIMSLLESMLILPSHAWDFLRFADSRKSRPKPDPVVPASEKRSIRLYELVLRVVLRFRYVFVFFILLLLAGSLYLAKNHMDLILFPTDDARSIIVQSELPGSTSLSTTSEKFRALEEHIKTIPTGNHLHYITSVGVHQDNPNDLLSRYGPYLGQIVITLKEESERNMSVQQIIEYLRPGLEKIKEQQGFLNLSFDKINMGPPIGKPVAVRISGEDLNTLKEIEERLLGIMSQTPGIQDIRSSLMKGKAELQFSPLPQMVAKSLLHNGQIAAHIRTAIDGTIAKKITLGHKLIPLRVKFRPDKAHLVRDLQNSHIRNTSGKMLQVRKLVHVKKVTSLSHIAHKDGKRTAVISANLSGDTSSVEINKALAEKFKNLRKDYPDFTISAGGEYEDTNDSVAGLAKSFVVALALIFFILVSQFNTLTQPFVVMAAIPFGVIGVILAFFAHGVPVSFLGMIGVIGLSGVVVNDSIVLVDFINKARQRGMEVVEACVYACKRRLRAVILTSFTTICGLLPLVYGIGGRDLFLEPAAMAMGYGLLFGTILVLLLIPCFYLVREDLLGLIAGSFRSRNKESGHGREEES